MLTEPKQKSLATRVAILERELAALRLENQQQTRSRLSDVAQLRRDLHRMIIIGRRDRAAVRAVVVDALKDIELKVRRNRVRMVLEIWWDEFKLAEVALRGTLVGEEPVEDAIGSEPPGDETE